MTTQTALYVDFDTPEIQDFAQSSDQVLIDPTLEDRRAFLAQEGYATAGLTRSGPPLDPSTLTQGAIGILRAEIRTYDLVEIATGAIRSQVETQLIHAQPITLTIKHELWLAPGLTPDQAQTIRDAFDSFEGAPGTNPTDFASQQGISADSYEALAYFELTKTGAPSVDSRQDIAVHRHYMGSEEFRLVRRSARFEEVRERDDGAYEVSDPENGAIASDILREIVGDNPAMRCENIQYKQERIATLLQYPEFRLDWVRHVIRLGCVRVTIKLPRLMYRNVKRVLFAVLAHPQVDRIIIAVLESCLTKAAFAGTVLGLATANIGVAGAAFKAVFTECVKQQVFTYVKCVLPELILLKERGGWRPV